MGKSTPKVPDPVKVSQAQGAENRSTAEYLASLNRVNQSSPFGSVSYSQNGTDPNTGAPIYSQSTSLSPELQSLFDSQIGSQQGISDAITGAIGRLPSGAFDPSGINTDAIAKASYDRGVTQMTPQWEEGARNLTGQMSDRGIPIGSEVWNNEQTRYDTAKNTSLDQISRQSQLDAGNEYQRQYGNKLTEYQLPQQQLAALMGNSQAVGSPQFSSVPQSNMAPVDTAGNTWAAYNANVQNAQNQQSNMMGGILGLGKLAAAIPTGGLSLGLPAYGSFG